MPDGVKERKKETKKEGHQMQMIMKTARLGLVFLVFAVHLFLPGKHGTVHC